MRLVPDSMPHVMAMAAIVATLMYLPVGAILALASFAVLGISFEAFLTFGGSLGGFQGLLAWWALGFIAALPYAVGFEAQK